MLIKLANVGFGSFVALEHTRRALAPQSASVQKLVREQKINATVVDLTNGRRTTAVIPLDNGQLVLVAAQPKKLRTQGLLIDLVEFRRSTPTR